MVVNALVMKDEPNHGDNVWRPFKLQSPSRSVPNTELRIEEAFREVKSLLNKLSPLNFSKIVEKYQILMSDDDVRNYVIDFLTKLLVEKAVAESLFSRWYLEMLSSLIDFYAADDLVTTIACPLQLSFTKNLLLLFEELRAMKLDLQLSTGVEGCIDVIMKADPEEKRTETEFKLRRKFVGFGRILGESFILGIITLNTVTSCIDTLLLSDHEYALESLCKLLSTSGKFLEYQMDITELDSYFDSIQQIIEKPHLSIRLRYVLLNLVDLKKNSWTSKYFIQKMNDIAYFLNFLSKTHRKSANSSLGSDPDSEFQITTKEAEYVNKIMNKFTYCRRNLAAVIRSFDELKTGEKLVLVRVIIQCIVKGDIYSEDGGNLFSLLIETGNIKISDVLDGIKSVIKAYCDNLIFADQQIWVCFKEIFKTLMLNQVMEIKNLIIDFKSFKTETTLEKKTKKKMTIEGSTELLWQRGVPVSDKRKLKYIKAKLEPDQQQNAEVA